MRCGGKRNHGAYKRRRREKKFSFDEKILKFNIFFYKYLILMGESKMLENTFGILRFLFRVSRNDVVQGFQKE